MLTNHLRVALRALRKHKGHASINVLGLALSMAVCLLIVLFIRDQRSYDAFHDGADRTYRLYSDFKSAVNADAHLYAMSPYALAEVARDELPGVEAAVGLRRGFGGEVRVGGELLPVQGLYAEPSFFDVFDGFRLAEGDPATALARPDGVVLAATTARRLFGEAEPVGQSLTFESGDTYTVTGVFADEAYKTHLPLEALAPMAALAKTEEDRAALAEWTDAIYGFYTYVRLAPDADAAAVEGRLPALIDAHFPAHDGYKLHGLHLQPITAINLGLILDNQLKLVVPATAGYFLSVLGLVIMLVACLNYVGLTTARALARAKEVGVRKVVGAQRWQLVAQFLAEAFLIASLALAVAALLLAWLLPAFNALQLVTFFNADLAVDPAGDAGLYGVVLTFVALVALGAGLYPALYLSRFQPASAVKGLAALRDAGGVAFQKGMTVVQFALAIVLVITTLTLYRQSAHLLSLDYGFERERVINVAMQGAPYEVFRSAAIQSPAVVGVASTQLLPGVDGRADQWLRTPAMEERVKGYAYDVDDHFVETLGLHLLAGRDFDAARPTEPERAVILNETAVDALGLGGPRDAVGQPVILDDSTEVEVVGVVADFQSNVAGVAMSPVVLAYAPERARWAVVRVQPGETDRALADLGAAWAALDQPRPLQAEPYAVQTANNPQALLLDDALRLVGFIAVLALVIAGLGLLALATFAAERRTKEVGIRKVLGADVRHVVLLLSREFAVLLGLAVVAAVPAAWFLNGLWLGGFAQRVGVGAGTLAAGAGLVLALAFVTVGVQAWRAAQRDPVTALRYE